MTMHMYIFAAAAAVLLLLVGVLSLLFKRYVDGQRLGRFDLEAAEAKRLEAARDRAERFIAGEDVYDGTHAEAVASVFFDAISGRRGDAERERAKAYVVEMARHKYGVLHETQMEYIDWSCDTAEGRVLTYNAGDHLTPLMSMRALLAFARHRAKKRAEEIAALQAQHDLPAKAH
jgi:hypothetical protein